MREIGGAPPTRAQLDVIAGEFLSSQLDRSRPLWEIAVVPRLADDRRGAIIGKVHHAMVDGIAAVELGMLLFDLAPDAALPERVDWQPEQAAGPLQLAAGPSWMERLSSSARRAGWLRLECRRGARRESPKRCAGRRSRSPRTLCVRRRLRSSTGISGRRARWSASGCRRSG